MPELSFHNYQLNAADMPIIPTMCITIACGAISGFHATQSPLMARCVGNEKQCRSVFYGSMIMESIIALIWAAVAMAFFGGPEGLNLSLAEHGNNAAWAVDTFTLSTLGMVGAKIAILGVVAAPITTGDTAFRAARLLVADMLHVEQKTIYKRLLICLPLFVVGYGLTLVNFDVIWRYFSWSNQLLSVFTLWAIFVWLKRLRKNYWVALIPAVAMTFIVSSFVFLGGQFLDMDNHALAFGLAALLTAAISALLVRKK